MFANGRQSGDRESFDGVIIIFSFHLDKYRHGILCVEVYFHIYANENVKYKILKKYWAAVYLFKYFFVYLHPKNLTLRFSQTIGIHY